MTAEIAFVHHDRPSDTGPDGPISPELNAKLLLAIFGPMAKAIIDRHVYCDNQGQRIERFPAGHWARAAREIRAILAN